MKKAKPSPSLNSPAATAGGAAVVSSAHPFPLAILEFDRKSDHLAAFRWLAASVPVTWTLTEQIASKIGDRILSEALPPGAWLREQDFADEFGVSRGPIRDAFQLLMREGLVHLHARRGAQVTVLTAREVRDIFEIRANLFRMVARTLASQRDAAYISALESAIGKLESLARTDAGADQYAKTVFRLSLYSASACGNERLCDIITSLSLQTYRYSRIGLRTIDRRQKSLKLWRATLEAIRSGDPERAERVAAQRISENGEAAEKLLSANQRAAADATN